MNPLLLCPADPADWDGVRALLLRAGLPCGGLQDPFPSAYVVARSSEGLVGCGGLETYGRAGLLRSVAVSDAHRGRGIGDQLVADRLHAARRAGVDSVYLLTTTAVTFFERLGFVATDRNAVPPGLAASPEFAGVCPVSAVCLRLSPIALAGRGGDELERDS